MIVSAQRIVPWTIPALLHQVGEARQTLLNWRLCSNRKEAVHEADLVVDTFLAGEALAASDHTHNLKALNGGCCCLRRLDAAGRLDDSRECAMIRLKDVV